MKLGFQADIHFTMSTKERLIVLVVGFFIGNPNQIPNSRITVTSTEKRHRDWIADRVKDGIYRFDADNCRCCTALDRPAWVQLTLDKAYLVEKILILGRTDYDGQFENITLSLGQDQDVAFTSKNWSVAMTKLTPPREVDTVRVSGASGQDQYMIICEIMIYKQPDCLPGKYSANCSKECHCLSGPCDSVTGTCLTAGCKDGWRGLACNEQPIQILNSRITVTSYGSQYLPAAWANDGKVNGRGVIAENCGCCAALQRPAWVQLTLDKTYIVEQILVLGRNDGYAAEQFYNITLSLGRQDQSLQDEAFTLKNGTVALTILTPPRAVYTVRVSGGTVTADSHMTICEIMIYRQADVNDCAPNPCKNGGQCTDEIKAYTCACAAGFRGTVCDTNINECEPNPCLNGASCIDGINSFTCSCLAGYNGQKCETNINECSPNPCLNGAQCIDGVNASKCACVAGYQGSRCEININECSPNPCLNGAQCIDGVNAYKCRCVAGYQGSRCEININECDPNPCLNGARCIDGINYFTCACLAGYNGQKCETTEESIFTTECPECHCDKYYNAFIAVSSVLGVVVAAVIVVIVVYRRRVHRRYAGGTRAKRESSSHTYDDLSPRNPNLYDCLQMATIEQAGR